ncbi:MAG TPA: hypothetical protein PK760_11225, partial [Flavobacteriales bacterium]|nr:hypothetical protein [Flavobacteriales bacterium]
MEGVTCSGGNAGIGDPALLILNAEEQQIDRVTFATVVSTVITQHNLNIVTESANVGSVFLDGVLVPAASFSTYAACPTMSHTSMSLTAGSHTLTCTGGLSAYVYGMGSAETYAYSVGAFTPIPPLVVDSVLCGLDSTGTLTLSPPEPLFSPWWSVISAPDDTLYQGLNYTFAPPGSDVYVVTGNELQSACQEQYFFSVEVSDPPALVITGGSTTVCSGESVQLNVTPTPGGTYVYNWWPDAQLDNGDLPNPVATPTHSDWFHVSVGSLNGCAVAVDSVYVTVVPGDVIHYEATVSDDQICLGDTVDLNIAIHQTIAFDEFEIAPDPAVWTSVSGAVSDNVCGSIFGNALNFNGGPSRVAETVDMNVLAGGTVRFSIHISDGVAPCEDADPG